jgi:mono/diheme cytochrome c family protein
MSRCSRRRSAGNFCEPRWRIASARLTLLAFGLCLVTGRLDAEQPATALPDAVRQIDGQLAALADEERQLRDEILQVRRGSTDSERSWQSLLGKIDQIRTQQASLIKSKQEQQQASEDAEKKRSEALIKAEEARKQVEEAQKKLAEFEKAAREASEMVQAATASIAELESKLVGLEPQIEPLTVEAGKAETVAATWRTKIEGLESRAAEFPQARRQLQSQAEAKLREAGQWVSFTDQIAPIFHQHCVACHNARNAQGRYNMANYAATLSVGESGPAILPGDTVTSHLIELIESGEMPYDADPLSEDQISLIRRWVDLGARLDSAADPETPLIRLMPRVTQSPPPPTYSAAVPVTALAVDPSSSRLASSGYHEVLIWTLDQPAPPLRLTNVAQRVYGLAFHPDGRRLAVASGTPGRLGEVKLFDSVSGQLLADLLVSEDVIFDVAFSPDGHRLAACGADGSIAIFAMDDPAARPRSIQDHADWVNSIAWSPDGRSLVSASRDKTAKVFDADSGRSRITFGEHDQNVTTALFVGDGSTVVSGGNDRKLRIWAAADGKPMKPIGGLGEEIANLGLVGDGRVASVASDNRLRIHAVADGKLVREIELPSDGLTALTVAPDGKSIFIGNDAGELFELSIDAESPIRRNWKSAPQSSPD